jgi:hypothetical protein
MPRLTDLQKSKNAAISDLQLIRNRLDPRTTAAYERKIENSNRKDTVKKLANDIKLIKLNTNINNQNLKTSDIKQETKKKKNVKEEIPIAIEKLEKLPKLVNRTVVDRIKFFSKENFEYSNITNMDKFYYAIRDAIKKFPDATSLSIFFRRLDGSNKLRGISIMLDDLVSFKKFKDAYDRIALGNFTGSDAIDNNELEIVFSNFALASAKISGDGKSDLMIFKVDGIEETQRTVGKKQIGNGDCSRVCLKKIIKDKEILEKLDNTELRELKTLDGLRNFISFNELPISIISNSFTLKRPHTIIVGEKEEKEEKGYKEFVIKDKKGIERNYSCSSVVIDKDIDIVYFHKINDAIATIIFDEFNQHYDIISDNKIEICDDVYLSMSCKVIKNNQVLFTAKQMNSNSLKVKFVETRFLCFDYETVIDFNKSSCMQEYSLSVLNLNDEELEELMKADDEKNEAKVAYIRKTSCMTFLGFDCSIKFINWVLRNQMDKAFVFVGFNNANFDNFILLDALLNYENNNTEFSVSDIFYNGSQLLNFFMCGRHNTFDIHKHLMGSLKANCESFKINCCAKKSFDHNKAQQLYLNGGLIEFITGNDELKEYNEYDVLATAVLFCKYRKALFEIEATKNYSRDLHNIKTVGSLIYKVFEASKNKKNYDLPKISYQQYTDLQKSKIAGRVELFNGVQKVEERLVSTDVCSLYPYVMSVAPVYYPCGNVVDTNKYMGDDVIGFYYCDIDQRNLKPNNLPKIYAKKTEIENNWGTEEVLENYLISNVMIGLLKEYGCKVVIKNGFYFTDKKKSCDMFDFLLDFMKAKNEEDSKKKVKDASYNPALRETLKLLMNSLSGKVIEGLHTEKTQDVNSVAEYMKIKDKSKSINFINAIGNKIFVTYEINAETVINKQRPIYLGVLIYDYAKRYMYQNSYSKVGLDELLYTDTDASKFRYNKFLSWKQEIDDKNIQVPHWKEVEIVDERYKNHKIYEADSKVFGSFEDELAEMQGDKYIFYCLEKKSWCYAVDGDAKFRFKGLNGSALLLNTKEKFIETKIINHKSKDGKDSWVENKLKIKNNTELEVYNFAQDNKHLAIEAGNEVNFFEQVYQTGDAYLLCCSFRKIVKNSARNVEIGNTVKYNSLMNKVQVNYTMKHISLKK